MKKQNQQSEQPESKAVFFNSFQYDHDMNEAQSVIAGLNNVLSKAYKLQMKQLKPDEMPFIENLFLTGSDILTKRIKKDLQESDSIKNLPETLALHSINLHMDRSDVKQLERDCENAKKSLYNRMPIAWKFLKIDQEGFLQIEDGIKKAYTVFIETPEQLEFYSRSLQVAEDLTRLYELFQQSNKSGFKYNSPDEFINRITQLFYTEDNKVKFAPDWIINI